MSRSRLFAMGAVAFLAGASGWADRAAACSVPVYRYALERWRSDPFRVVVFHRGPLSKPQAALAEDMGPFGLAGERHANLVVKTVDLNGSPDKEMTALWESQQSRNPQLPWVVVRYPAVVTYAPAWSGPLTKANVAALIDSPARKAIAKRVLSGETAVWILLESGNRKADDAAYARLKGQLEIEQKTLKLPEIDTNDIAGDEAAEEVKKLKISFSIIRVSRKDPKEKLLAEMLLGSEGSGRDSLRDADYVHQTMAFPIFGRGRIRYGLVGAGIAEDTIHEACAYLCGPCKCQIKRGVENRGMDLVMAVDWERMVTSTIRDKPLPPLQGLAGLQDYTPPTLLAGLPAVAAPKPWMRTAAVAARKPTEIAAVISRPTPLPPKGGGSDAAAVVLQDAGDSPSTSGRGSLLKTVGILFGVGVLVIIGASLFLRSKPV
ncbi:MAG: hypothetical protein ACE5KM_10475 [Planctomycetaceae bacterium]